MNRRTLLCLAAPWVVIFILTGCASGPAPVHGPALDAALASAFAPIHHVPRLP